MGEWPSFEHNPDRSGKEKLLFENSKRLVFRRLDVRERRAMTLLRQVVVDDKLLQTRHVNVVRDGDSVGHENFLQI